MMLKRPKYFYKIRDYIFANWKKFESIEHPRDTESPILLSLFNDALSRKLFCKTHTRDECLEEFIDVLQFFKHGTGTPKRKDPPTFAKRSDFVKANWDLCYEAYNDIYYFESLAAGVLVSRAKKAGVYSYKSQDYEVFSSIMNVFKKISPETMNFS